MEDSDDKILNIRVRHRRFLVTRNPVVLEIKQLLILAFFSILGVLARKGMTLLTSYSGSYVGGIIWANFTSCFIMGILVESIMAWDCFIEPRHRDLASAGGSSKAEVKFYVGLTTGFSGSFSSFSSWILETFIESANLEVDSKPFRNAGGYAIMQFFSVIITQLSVSICGFQFGKNIIQFYDPVIPGFEILEDISVLMGIFSWITVICLMAIKNWRAWTFSCTISPIACWLRYYLAKKYNKRVPAFPIGTFAANIIATVTLSIFYLLSRGKISDGRIINSTLSCYMIDGLQDGFSGTLSTVSTFVVEICNMRSYNSYIYGGVSIVVCFCFVIVILGSYSWTQGLVDPVC